MKKLKFHYKMELVFDAPVTEHHFLFRFLPMEDMRQRCYNLQYGIEPSGRIREAADGFGNRICAGEAMAAHDSLRVWAEGVAFVDRGAAVREEFCPLYGFASDYTRADGRLRDYLGKCLAGRKKEMAGAAFGEELGGRVRTGERGAREDKAVIKDKDSNDRKLLLHLMDCLHRDFSYRPGATDVTTTAAQAWERRAGVCQDYAHVFLCLCRMAGYGARYAAGMMAGEGATHAWTEVYVDGGWLGLDPTNNCLADDNYIKLSHGRDFGDCSVDRGCFKGFVSQRQNIYVKVEECYG